MSVFGTQVLHNPFECDISFEIVLDLYFIVQNSDK